MKIWEITQNNKVTEDATAGATDSVAVAGVQLAFSIIWRSQKVP